MIDKTHPGKNEGSGYDLELDKICQTINEKEYNTILLQFPEGLKQIAAKVKDTLEKGTQTTILIWADPCFGACDIPLQMSLLNIDLLVQFGHADMPNLVYDVPVMFIEAHSDIEVLPVVKKALRHLKGKIGLITTIQHIHKLKEIENFLSEKGNTVLIGEGTGRIARHGQVLGCNLSSATSISSHVDSYLFIGSGNFHAIGVAQVTGKPVIIADPYLCEIRDVKELRDRLKRQRHGAITKAESAASFGIIVSTKPGQARIKLAYSLKKLIEKHEKTAYILVMNHISPTNLKSFKLDAFVSCACPRIALDDYMMYDFPLLTPIELRIALGDLQWEDYRFDELV